MKEQYDAVLVHCYMFRYTGEKTKGFLRNHMQDSAAAELYFQGKVRKIFLAGGYLWGDDKPSLAQIMELDLVRMGVRRRDIVIEPKIKDTSEEVDLFLETAQKRDWSSLASLANFTHLRYIDRIYQARGRSISLMSAEDVLENLEFRGRYPYRAFLKRFRGSKMEKVFGAREDLVVVLHRLGLEKTLKIVAQSNSVERIKSFFDS